MTRGEKVNAALTALSVLVAGFAAYFAWTAQRDASSLQRPHLRVDVELFESRLDNGIRLHNSGMTPARIYSYQRADDVDDAEVKQADLDLASVGWQYGHLVHHPINGGLSIAAGQGRPMISIDKRIGQTDIAILDRKFSKTEFTFCYCDMGGNKCWRYVWAYASRENVVRNEVQVRSCR